jgi:hypothetical protein
VRREEEEEGREREGREQSRKEGGGRGRRERGGRGMEGGREGWREGRGRREEIPMKAARMAPVEVPTIKSNIRLSFNYQLVRMWL